MVARLIAVDDAVREVGSFIIATERVSLVSRTVILQPDVLGQTYRSLGVPDAWVRRRQDFPR